MTELEIEAKKAILDCHARHHIEIQRKLSIEYGFRRLEMLNAAFALDFQRVKRLKEMIV